MTRYITTGQNNWQPRPQSGNSREWVHGPLEPLARKSSPWITRIAFASFLLLAGYHIAFGLWNWSAF